MSDSWHYIGESRDSFDCTPQQYHANLDMLWAALPKERTNPPYSKTVFERVVEYIKYLEERWDDMVAESRYND